MQATDGALLSMPIDDTLSASLCNYVIYGLQIRSAVPLPLPEHPVGPINTVDCTIRYGDSAAPSSDDPIVAGLPCSCPEHQGRMVMELRRGRGGAWFWYEHVGTIHVLPDARRIDVYPIPGHDARALGVILVGQALTFVLHQLGYPSLHASAVSTGRGAIVFLGPRGAGKSTMAAAFLRRGATLLTDDVLPLHVVDGTVRGLPSMPLMKIWQPTATGTLHLSEVLPTLAARSEKKWLSVAGRFNFASESAPVIGTYVLARRGPGTGPDDPDKITIRPLSAREGLTGLLEHTSNRAYLRPGENAPLIPLYGRLLRQAPVRLLSYPDGFGHQDSVCAAILDDAEAQR